MYTAKLTYPVYNLNSSLFVSVIKEVLEAEFNDQITNHSNTLLPIAVKTDEYLLNPVADKEIDPSFVSVIKAKTTGTEFRFASQQQDLNTYVIGVLADGLTNLRKILDYIYIILNDNDVKNYLFDYKNTSDERLIADHGSYYVKEMSSEFEVSKTLNDKEIIYGYLVLNARISESVKINDYETINSVDVEHLISPNENSIKHLTNL